MERKGQQTIRRTIREAARHHGVLRPRDVEPFGVRRQYVQRMYAAGELQRLGRGLYALPDYTPTGNQGLVQIAVRVPGAVICLVSALAFHKVTTQTSDRIWIAVGHGARRPALDYPPIELVRMSQPTLWYGVERHNISGVEVSVFSPAKTVADCFKYRNRVGLDVAMEALRDVWQRRLCTIEELWRAARVCRVSRVMRPYIEATV